MASLTSRLKLLKPARLELVNVENHVNANLDRLDAGGVGAYVCTSTTRPNGNNHPVFEGMIIFESDSKEMLIRVGTAWIPLFQARQEYRSLISSAERSIPTAAYTTLSGSWISEPGSPSDAQSGITYNAGTLKVSRAGFYEARFTVNWTASPNTVNQQRILRFCKNDINTTLRSIVAPGGAFQNRIMGMTLNWEGALEAGDTLIPQVYQDSGVAVMTNQSINAGSSLYLCYVGPKS